MNSPLTYSDKVPTVPGWYWRRDQLGAKPVRVPDAAGVYPIHWRQWRDQRIAANNWRGVAKRQALANDDGWRVEYAGPIPEPR